MIPIVSGERFHIAGMREITLTGTGQQKFSARQFHLFQDEDLRRSKMGSTKQTCRSRPDNDHIILTQIHCMYVRPKPLLLIPSNIYEALRC